VRSVPMSANVGAAMGDYCKGRLPGALVFEHEAKPGEPVCGTALYRRFGSAARRAKLPPLLNR